MTRKSLLFSLILVLGCHQGPESPYPEWAQPDPEFQASSSSGNAYDGYVLAAQDALKSAPEEANRVAFSENAKKRGLERLGRALAKLEKSSRLPCEFEYRVQDPFAPDPSAKGWRVLGRALVWRIEAAVKNGEYGKAANSVAVATKFGFDLAQGDAQTATLGFTICNEARRAIAPALARLSAEQLATLYTRVSRVVTKNPGFRGTVNHEERRLLLGVQYVQDCYRKKSFDDLLTRFGNDSRSAVNYLRGLDQSKRVSYFESFGKTSTEFVRHWESEIDKPSPSRNAWVEPDGTGPWRKFARGFWGTLEPLASMADSCVAHTKLLALSAWAMARAKAHGRPMPNLTSLPKALTADPYSGMPFIYVVSGPDFRLYSVGADGKDDLGESDENGQYPDVVLEFSNS